MGSRNKLTLCHDGIAVDSDALEAVNFMFDGREVWLPRSQIGDDYDKRTVNVPAWLAAKEGLENYAEEYM